MYISMLLRLYANPLYLFILSILAYYVLGHWIPNSLSSSKLFSVLSEKSILVAPMVSTVILAATGIGALGKSYKLWKWLRGHGEFCSNCGGMVALKTGRYGMYHKCLVCGKKKYLVSEHIMNGKPAGGCYTASLAPQYSEIAISVFSHLFHN